MDKKIKKQEYYKLRVIDFIRANLGISRQNIGKELHLSPATITNFVDDLIKHKIIQEIGQSESTGGRKPIALSVIPQIAYAIGIDMEAQINIRVSIVDFAMNPIVVEKMPIENIKDINKITSNLVKLIKRLIEENRIKMKYIIGIGIGFPLLVNIRNNIHSHLNRGYLLQTSIKETLENEFPIPISIDTNGRTPLVAEQYIGAGKESKNFLFLLVRYGIVLGIVIDDKIYRGISNAAGLVGHTILFNNATQCECGAKGCIEAWNSGKSILNEVRQAIKKNSGTELSKEIIAKKDKITLNDVIYEAKKGNKFVLSLFEKLAKNTGILIANLVNIFNPEKVIISGILNDFENKVRILIERKIRAYAVEEARVNLEIIFSKSGEYTGAIGAGILAINSSSHQFIKKRYYS
ncbi:ROK family protein [bacterium]|nr:ROK family protein [bacterium]